MWKVIGSLALLVVSSELAIASSQATATECARELFREMLVHRGYAADAKLEGLLDETIIVERQDRPSWSVLHGDVFLAMYTFQRPVVEAWVIANSDSCAVLGGDLETILGVRLGPQDQVARAVHEYNAYVRSTGVTPSLSSPNDLEKYVSAVLALVLPSHQYRVLTEFDDVPMRAQTDVTERQRALHCLQGVQPVNVETGSVHSKVTLFSWEEVGGIVA